MNKILLFCCFISLNMSILSQNIQIVKVTLEIHNVIPNKGEIYGAIYLNDKSYKLKKSDKSLMSESNEKTITKNIELPVGECLISVFNDLDNNKELKTGLFGIQKEPVGITNWNGRGILSFNKLKVNVGENKKKIEVYLFSL